ncbi:hypothetical protein Nepgr_021124 [Nepenthes gracilis]|uniref:Uncharacterized protein n=1 Tax=Nepenthes gracilis TaxID=150966 RepID=A0AAD3SXG1_NEPGR|nr:hypothetical protein Nepgr_021124 [Nepenthes gracilis]
MRSATSKSSRPESAARSSEGELGHFKIALNGEEIMLVAPRTISTGSQPEIAHRPQLQHHWQQTSGDGSRPLQPDLGQETRTHYISDNYYQLHPPKVIVSFRTPT